MDVRLEPDTIIMHHLAGAFHGVKPYARKRRSNHGGFSIKLRIRAPGTDHPAEVREVEFQPMDDHRDRDAISPCDPPSLNAQELSHE